MLSVGGGVLHPLLAPTCACPTPSPDKRPTCLEKRKVPACSGEIGGGCACKPDLEEVRVLVVVFIGARLLRLEAAACLLVLLLLLLLEVGLAGESWSLSLNRRGLSTGCLMASMGPPVWAEEGTGTRLVLAGATFKVRSLGWLYCLTTW